VKNPNDYQYRLGMYDRVGVQPRLQPSVIPQSPVKHDYWSGIIMPGTFQFLPCYLDYYQTQTQVFTAPFAFPPSVNPTRVFVGQAPVRGVYTGVQNGR